MLIVFKLKKQGNKKLVSLFLLVLLFLSIMLTNYVIGGFISSVAPKFQVTKEDMNEKVLTSLEHQEHDQGKSFDSLNIPVEDTYLPPMKPEKIHVNMGYIGDFQLSWRDLATFTDEHVIMAPRSLPSYFPQDWLEGRGVKLTVVVWPWNSSNSALDTYYNATFRDLQFQKLKRDLDFNWKHLVTGVILGDEEPISGSYNWFWFTSSEWPEFLLKYNETYHTETGFYFKSLSEMTTMEQYVFQEWLANRTCTAMNMIYDRVKSLNPRWSVSWSILSSPGVEPDLVKTDVYGNVGVYSQNDQSIYSLVRAYKTLNASKPVNVGLWGYPLEGAVEFSKNDLKRQFWVAYTAGANKLYYFNRGWSSYKDETTWQYKDTLYWNYIKAIAGFGRNFPVITPEPSVLLVTSERGVATQWEYHSPGLTSYDITTQRLIALGKVNLSKYKVVVVAGQVRIWEQTAARINEYVDNGGNLLLLNTWDNNQNEYGLPASTRINPFQVLTNPSYYSKAYLEMKATDLLQATLRSSDPISRRAWNITGKQGFQGITLGAPEENEGFYSLIYYQNTTNPKAGKIIINGLNPPDDESFYLSVLEQLYTKVFGIEEGVSTPTTRDAIIGVGKDSQGNLNVASTPVPSNQLVSIPVNITKWFGTRLGSWTVIRDSYLDKLTALYMNTFTDPTTNMIQATDMFVPWETIHFTIKPVPVTPEPYHSIYPLPQTIVKGETISIRVNVTVRGIYSSMINYQPLISTDDGLKVLGYLTSKSSDQTITPDNPLLITWFLQVSNTGKHSAYIYGKAMNPETGEIAYSKSKQIQFKAYPGKISVDIQQHEFHVTPNDKFYFDAYTTIFNEQALKSAKMDYIILDYKFGNPGAIIDLPALDPNHPLHTKKLIQLEGGSPGMIGMLKVVVYQGESNYWAEDYAPVYMHEAKIIINATTKKLGYFTGRTSEMQLQLKTMGIAAARNVTIQVAYPPSIKAISPETIYYSSLPLNKTITVPIQFEALNPGKQPIKITITGENMGKQSTTFTITATSITDIIQKISAVTIALGILGYGIILIARKTNIITKLKSRLRRRNEQKQK